MKTKNKRLYKPVIVKKEQNDEHFYFVDDEFFPSVTKILDMTEPMAFALRQWIGDVGNEKANQKFENAAARGTLLHKVCERLLIGEEVKAYDELPSDRDRKVVAGFINWFQEYNPVIPMANEIRKDWAKVPTIELVVANQIKLPKTKIFGKYKGQILKYAGTLDIFCYINDEPYILDIKTSAGVYDSHFLQISAYQAAFYAMTGIKAKRAILHLNDRLKSGIKFIDDDEMKGEYSKQLITFDDFLVSGLKLVSKYGKKAYELPKLDVYPEILSLYTKENDETITE